MKKLQLVFVAIVIVGMLVPSVGMAWAPTTVTTENRELAAAPQAVMADGSPNIAIASEAGAWFEDHFALRNQAVSLNAVLRAGIFGVSATDQVIVGTEGWLYYNGTLSDYLGRDPMSDAALRNAAHNLLLTQAFVESQGAAFAFVLAPNKNSLYPEHMPPYYLQGEGARNAERLLPYLEEYGVNWVDVGAALAAGNASGLGGAGGLPAGGAGSAGGTGSAGSAGSLAGGGSGGLPAGEAYYLKGDSHWNNIGAYVAAEAIAAELGMEGLEEPAAWEQRSDFLGDLNTMLYPYAPQPETQYYYAGINDVAGFLGSRWQVTGGGSSSGSSGGGSDSGGGAGEEAAGSSAGEEAAGGSANEEAAGGTSANGAGSGVEADTLTTKGQGSGTLLMFRDSFGNALIPYLATQTGEAHFSKLVPYNAMQVLELKPDYVVLERAERHLAYLAENPPYAPSPQVSWDATAANSAAASAEAQAASSLEVAEEGDFVTVFGSVDPRLLEGVGADLRIIVVAEAAAGGVAGSLAFEAFNVSNAQEGTDNGFKANIPASALRGGIALAAGSSAGAAGAGGATAAATGSPRHFSVYVVCNKGVFLAKSNFKGSTD